MSILEPTIKHLIDLGSRIPEIAKKAVRENIGEIEDILKYSQLGKGMNSDGLPLAWEQGRKSGNGKYAPTTPNYAKLGIPSSPIKPKTTGQPYNFEWTGDTFRMMGIELKGDDEYVIFTRTGKQDFLESIYGRIFDLTEKHNSLVNETIILPYLEEFILSNMLEY